MYTITTLKNLKKWEFFVTITKFIAIGISCSFKKCIISEFYQIKFFFCIILFTRGIIEILLKIKNCILSKP